MNPTNGVSRNICAPIENQIGLKRGMLSDAQEVEKTAFEVASTAGDYNLSLLDLQQVWFDGVREYLTLCDTLGKMYRYCDQSAWDVTEQLAITWGERCFVRPGQRMAAGVRACTHGISAAGDRAGPPV